MEVGVLLAMLSRAARICSVVRVMLTMFDVDVTLKKRRGDGDGRMMEMEGVVEKEE